ncbi:hypothetical protein MCEMRE226_00080 [Candidatus Nanopelagicaceae bacterium]
MVALIGTPSFPLSPSETIGVTGNDAICDVGLGVSTGLSLLDCGRHLSLPASLAHSKTFPLAVMTAPNFLHVAPLLTFAAA